MSPDLEWRVENQLGKQTITQTTPPRSPRWRGWVIGLVVLLGIGLGVLYRSIPEAVKPAPTFTPLPTLPPPMPTAMPAALYQTIAREAQALAEGDRATLAQTTDIPDFKHYQALTGKFGAWGIPANEALYSILDFRLTTQDKAWVEVNQFRIDRYVQEMRFYRLRNGQWRRIDFDPSFWSGQTETSDTPHFKFTYFVEDYDLIEPLATLLEADYEQICTDLDCPQTAKTCIEAFDKSWCSVFPRDITVRFSMRSQGDQDQYDFAENGDLVVTMPSLRLLDQLAPIYQEDSLRNAIAWLHMGRLAYGTTTFQDSRMAEGHGRALMIAIFFREYNQLLKRSGSEGLDQSIEFEPLDLKNLPPLDDVWNASLSAANKPQIYSTANALVEFVDEKYGWTTVVKLSKAIGTSKSMAEAIETSTGLSYVEFEEQWRAWVIAVTPAVP